MIILGENRYGKAEIRLLCVERGRGPHEIRDLNVSVALAGDLDDTHLTGDNTKVLPTDTQKNTVYAFAREHGVPSPEEFGGRLARHFVDCQPSIHRARIALEEYAWERLNVHSFVRKRQEIRTARVAFDGARCWTVSGLKELTVLKTTGSEFSGFIRDEYTTLRETTDRVLATDVTAEWRHESDGDWNASYEKAKALLLTAFGDTHSLSLQQTLFAMGRSVLDGQPSVCEIRLSLPNKHHFDLSDDGATYVAADRPYGLIEGTVQRDDAPPAGLAWW